MITLVRNEEGRVREVMFLHEAPLVPDGYIEISNMPQDLILSTCYIKDGELKISDASPGEFFIWDNETEKWIADLERAKRLVKGKIDNVLKSKLYREPCSGFDADMASRSRISGLLQRLERDSSLPTGWVGWRDAENNMHWSSDTPEQVYIHLSALSSAIEDKEQAMLVSAWMHKKNIDDSDDLEYILSYPVEEGW
jgi:hypothetical protein